MKLSELPRSIAQSIKLRCIPKTSLGKQAQKTIPAIVSLTSIPSRLRTIDITIRSMMQQSYQPQKIILWLEEGLQDQLPKRLKQLQGELFEIQYSPYTFSHRKLIHSLALYPKTPIITCDDDVIYHKDTIKQLYAAHLDQPAVVIGNRCREITYQNGEVLGYKKWPFLHQDPKHQELVMPIGAFCVLYPPHSLDQEVSDVALFMQLAPRADDLWFKAMAIKKGTLSIQNNVQVPEPVPIIGTQFIALKKKNKDQDKNRIQWKQIQSHYAWDKNTILGLFDKTA